MSPPQKPNESATAPAPLSSSTRWAFNISDWKPSYDELARISGLIQREEKERIGEFLYIKDAKASLIGRLMMRKLITQRLQIGNDKIELIRDPNNKPILIRPTGFYLQSEDSLVEECLAEAEKFIKKNKLPLPTAESVANSTAILSTLNFNVSHQGSYAVLASDSSCDRIGIDIMNKTSPGRIADSVSEYFRMMRKQFTDFEWVQIKTYYGTSDAKQLEKFTRFWSLKEAYVKAIGTGIITDLTRMEFHTSEDLPKSGKVITTTKIKVDGEWRFEWDFEERFIDQEHIVAVAKEYKERIGLTGDEVREEDLVKVEKEQGGAEGGGQYGIPNFETVQLDWLIRDMKLIQKPDCKWVKGFLRKKEKNR